MHGLDLMSRMLGKSSDGRGGNLSSFLASLAIRLATCCKITAPSDEDSGESPQPRLISPSFGVTGLFVQGRGLQVASCNRRSHRVWLVPQAVKHRGTSYCGLAAFEPSCLARSCAAIPQNCKVGSKPVFSVTSQPHHARCRFFLLRLVIMAGRTEVC